MKYTIILALLVIGAVVGIQHADAALTEKTFNKIQACNWDSPACKKVAQFMNQLILKDPRADIHQPAFIGAKYWVDVLPERTLQTYALYHPDFYYGQRIPVGQQIFLCYDCDVKSALDAQDKYKIKLYIIPSS